VERVDVDGLAIAYERAGTGAPMVLLHGYVGDGPSVWRHQIDALSDEYTVVAWDAPGAGGSPDPPETFGIAGYADCLARFIEVLRLGRRTSSVSRLGARLELRCRAAPATSATSSCQSDSTMR
jgi:pimeloyl-ACP methyl ester carboxylesterase